MASSDTRTPSREITRRGAVARALGAASAFTTACNNRNRRPKAADTLRYALITEPGTLDPAFITETPTSELLQNIFEGLVQIGPNNLPVPSLAKRWSISPDGLEYRFQLRPGARFHNNRVCTAEDVRFCLERALHPKTKSPVALNYLGGIQGAHALATGKAETLSGAVVVDDHTLVIRLEEPQGYFLGALAYATGWVVCREALERTGNHVERESCLGTGPFRLAEYRSHSKVRMDRNPNYDAGLVALSRIDRPIVLEASTRHALYENGDIDLVSLTIPDYLRDLKHPVFGKEVVVTPAAVTIYAVMQQKLEPAFKDVRVRQAMTRAVDRDEMVRVGSSGVWVRADGFLPPGMPGYSKELRRQPFDPASAKRLLAEAGYPGGRGFPTLTLQYVKTAPASATLAALLRAHLQENLGITVNLMERELVTFRNECATGKVAFGITDWGADYVDPQNFLSTILHTGAKIFPTGYSNSRFDSLCDRADAMQAMERRIPLYREADQIAVDDAAILPLIYGAGRSLVKPYVKGIEQNLMSYTPHFRTRIEKAHA